MTLEERVAILEKELSELKKAFLENKVAKDWRKTVGSAANDPGFDEMVRLGREYREQQREDYD
jgi:hypothetical protein